MHIATPIHNNTDIPTGQIKYLTGRIFQRFHIVFSRVILAPYLINLRRIFANQLYKNSYPKFVTKPASSAFVPTNAQKLVGEYPQSP